MKKLILLCCLFTLNLTAQDNSPPNDEQVSIQFNVLLDGKKIETDSVQVGFVSHNSMQTHVLINDNFTTFFKANKTYWLVITHPKYNRQILKIFTYNIPEKTKINIYLSSKDEDCYIGEYKYNSVLKKYVKHK